MLPQSIEPWEFKYYHWLCLFLRQGHMSQTAFKLANLDLKCWDYLIFFFLMQCWDQTLSFMLSGKYYSQLLSPIFSAYCWLRTKQTNLYTTHFLSWAYTNLETFDLALNFQPMSCSCMSGDTFVVIKEVEKSWDCYQELKDADMLACDCLNPGVL